MIVSAPAASPLTMSPVYRTPPSPMIGTPEPLIASAHSWMALNCGRPTPATTRVVQIEPGPTPTFTASTPVSTSARAPSPVATLPATTCRSG